MLNPFPMPLIDRVFDFGGLNHLSKLVRWQSILVPSPIDRLSPAITGLKTESALGTALAASLDKTGRSRLEPSVFSVIRRMRALPDLLDRLERDFGLDLFERLTREDIELLLEGPPANADEETRRRWGQALWRLTSGMSLLPRRLSRDSSTKSAPEQRARQRIYNTALIVAAKSAKERQRVRIGTKWVTDERGRWRPIIPAEELTTRELWRFMRARGFTQIPGGVNRGTREANSGRRVGRAAPEEFATPVQHEAPDSMDPRVARLLERLATPRQREVFRLLRDGYTLAEVARRLGISPSTARVQWWRLQRKARTAGRPQM